MDGWLFVSKDLEIPPHSKAQGRATFLDTFPVVPSDIHCQELEVNELQRVYRVSATALPRSLSGT